MTGAPWFALERLDVDLPDQVGVALATVRDRARGVRLPLVAVGDVVMLAAGDFRAWFGDLPTDEQRRAVAPHATGTA